MNPMLIIWKKELVDNFRDKRTVATALLMPVLLMPAILIGTFKIQESQAKKAQTKVAKVVVVSATTAPTLVQALAANPLIQLVEAADFRAAIAEGAAMVAIEHDQNFEQQLRDVIPSKLSIYSKSSSFDAASAVGKVQNAIDAFNRGQAATRLEQQHVSPAVLTAVVPEFVDLATASERGGLILSLLLPMFIVLFAIIGGMYIAIDVSAGEKERKTLEALLATPASRLNIVLGKFAAVTTMAVITIILSVTSMAVAFKFFPPNVGIGAVETTLTPTAITVMGAVGIILAIMFSGLLLSVSIFAKSYKEAQNYISPFYLLAVLPVSLVNAMPDLKPVLWMYCIPGVNAVFVLKEALMSTYSLPHILLTFGSLLAFAVLGIVVATNIYSREDVLFRS